MHLVFKDKHGDFRWNDKIETESLEAFVEKFNKRARAAGSNKDVHYIDSPKVIMELEWDGRIRGTWHPCDKNANRLI